MPCFQEKLLSLDSREPYCKPTQVDQVENTKAIERTWVKELGKMVP